MGNQTMLIPWPDSPPTEAKLVYWEQSLRSFVSGIRHVIDWSRPNLKYLELGSFCGASTLYVSQLKEDVHITCIDAWDERGGYQYKSLSEQSLQVFQANLWSVRDRVDMIQSDTILGMHIAHERGLVPDIIFIDADHSYEAVKQDIATAKELWPEAAICGDDFDETNQAVLEAFGTSVGVIGMKFWWEIGAFQDDIKIAVGATE